MLELTFLLASVNGPRHALEVTFLIACQYVLTEVRIRIGISSVCIK